ncbi:MULTISPECIES: hypothetical protein [Micromonospora]|uniref:PQQ-like domain-containing protein n=1 Tax=Micromonospora yangpuensis TaxID=683228 RepID=A0A1C6U511_9ACTN|nr:hypothetical protein [Micromonospora yangpuensis]GGL92148.1 hypothetical protein GCM10012279_07310 [Micromonospora yangpuensis]SCL49117.1 hypothetical protein GA0070617_1084 [Micromonospora yangpuensis]
MSGVPQRPAVPAGEREPSVPVGQDELERALRESFARQADLPRPLSFDPAGVAIRRANRTLRRRTVAGVALAAVATAVVSTGVAQLGGTAGPPDTPVVVLGDPPGPSSAASAGPVRPAPPAVGAVRAETDLIVGTSLGTFDGGQIELTGVGPIERAQRMADGGWLVVGAPTAAGRALWAVQPSGTAQVLLAGAEAIVVGADGRRVAWRDGAEIFTAGVVGGQLVATARTVAEGAATPVRVVGDAVLLRRAPDRPGHALWRPGSQPSDADRATRHIYGVRPDGRLVGQVTDASTGRGCLALLDPARALAAQRLSCVPGLGADGHGAVSADGRWLLVNGDSDSGPEARLVDLDTLGASPTVRVAGPALTGAVAWASPQLALYADATGALVRVRVDRALAYQPATSTTLAGTSPQQRPVVVTPSVP